MSRGTVVTGAPMLAEQEQQLTRARELRCVTESTPSRIERGRKLLRGPIEHTSYRDHAVPGKAPKRSEALDDGGGGLENTAALLAPDPCDLIKDFREARPSPSRRRREVGASVERLQGGCEPHAHRPPSRAGRHLHERHVYPIDVRPFLAIDLDRHIVAIEQLGHRGVLEALVLHHMAPVTGRVADREEDRLVFPTCLLEGGITPGVPVHRVVLVLKKIRTLFGSEAVWHLLRLASRERPAF